MNRLSLIRAAYEHAGQISPADVDYLLDEVERLQAEVERQRKQLLSLSWDRPQHPVRNKPIGRGL